VRLFDFEARWARVIGRSVVPVGTLGGATDHLDLGERFRDECAQPPWYSGLLLRFSLWVTWLSPLFVLGRWRTFGGLDEADRVRVLEALLKSPRHNLRLAIIFLKLTACVLALGDARTLEQLDAYGLGAPPPKRAAS
jgi:hypothetical protein